MSEEFRAEMQKLALSISEDTDQDALAEVADEMETIFGESGSLVVLQFSGRYGVSLDDAIKRPGVFKQALFFLLGDLGSRLVMDRLNRRIQSVATPVARSSFRV